jgi:uncharacterized protein
MRPAGGENLSPLEAGERLEAVDALRGVALFGVLLTNMPLYSGPMSGLLAPGERWTAWYDRAVEFLVRSAAEGKFYTLFSLLFGFGFSIQLLRAERRGVSIVPLYARRLMVLFLIGAAHLLFIWNGDILTTYAVVGFALLAFRNAQPKTLLRAAVAFLLAPAAVTLIGIAAIEGARAVWPAVNTEMAAEIDAHEADVAGELSRETAAYRSPSYHNAFWQRIEDLDALGWITAFVAPLALGMFLLGLWTGRKGVAEEPHVHRRLLMRTLLLGLLIGVPGNWLYAALYSTSRDYVGWASAGLLLMQSIAAPALALAYAAAVLLLWQTARGAKVLRCFVPVGRTALTNYLLQSVIATTLFYGYGFAWFGRTGPAAQCAIAAAIFSVQLVVSRLWMSQFRYGPVEWLWRWATYGVRPPFRRVPASVTAQPRQ